MTEFDDRFAASAWPVLLAQFGATVTYRQPLVDPASFTAIVGPVESELREGRDGTETVYARNVGVATTDVAAPKRGHEVEIAGETWIVDRVEAVGGGHARLRMVRSIAIERARPGYRGRS